MWVQRILRSWPRNFRCLFGACVTLSFVATLSSCLPTSENNRNLNIGNKQLTIISSSSTALPDGVIGRSYTYTFLVSGGAGSVSWTELSGALGGGTCAGLSLSKGGLLNGLLAGAPGTCNLDVEAVDSNQDTATAHLTLTIHAALSVTPVTLGNGVQGRTFSQGVLTAGGLDPLTSCTTRPALPEGLTVTASGTACLISGIPQGLYDPLSITIVVTDSNNLATPSGTASLESTLHVNPPLAINRLPTRILNGLVGFPYGGLTFTASGGSNDGAGLTWTQAGATSESGLCAPGGTTPPGLSLGGTTGTISGTPSAPSLTPSDFQFQVCVEDEPTASTAAGSATSDPVTLTILRRYAYVGSALRSIEVIDLDALAFVEAIQLPPNSSIQSLTTTPDGRYLFALDNGNSLLFVLDTMSNTQVPGSPFALPASCINPWDVAVPPDPTLPGANRLYVSCSAADDVTYFEEVLVFDQSNPGGEPIGVIRTGPGSAPLNLAVRGDNTRVYVALNGSNQLCIIDNTLPTPAVVSSSPFNLDPTTSQPSGIGLVPNGISLYAYVAKQNTGSQNYLTGSQGIEIVDVTTDEPKTVTNILLTPGANSFPTSIVADPRGEVVFVTLQGTGQLALLDNTIETPRMLPGSPFGVADPSQLARNPNPYGLLVPPPPSGPLMVYVSLWGSSSVAILDGTDPTVAVPGSPIILPVQYPGSMRAIPVPK